MDFCLFDFSRLPHSSHIYFASRSLKPNISSKPSWIIRGGDIFPFQHHYFVKMHKMVNFSPDFVLFCFVLFPILSNILLKIPFYNSAEIHCWFPQCGRSEFTLGSKESRSRRKPLGMFENTGSWTPRCTMAFGLSPFQTRGRSRSCDIGSEEAVVTPGADERPSSKSRREAESVGSVARCLRWPSALLGWPSPLLFFPPGPWTPHPRERPRPEHLWPRRATCRRTSGWPGGNRGSGAPQKWRGGMGGGTGGGGGRSDGVSEEMKVVYARSGCLDGLEWRAGDGGSAGGSRLIDHPKESHRHVECYLGGGGDQCRACVAPAATLRNRLLLSKLMKNMSAGHGAQKEAALKAAEVITAARKVRIFFPFILSGRINSSRPATAAARALRNVFTSAESRRGWTYRWFSSFKAFSFLLLLLLQAFLCCVTQRFLSRGARGGKWGL